MRNAVIIGIAAAATASAGCGQGRAQDAGPATQRNYQVGAFQAIEVAGPYDVTVRTGGAPSVSASGPQKMLDRLVVEVKGDRLLIHPKKERRHFSWSSNHGKTRITVTASMLRAAAIAGSGGIQIDKISGGQFDGSIAGSGDLSIDSLAVQALKLSIAGSGDVRARSGQARSAKYSIAGSGGIDAPGIRTESAEISIAGSGSVNGQATGTADISIMGSGDVDLSGGAKCKVSKMGSGSANCS